MTNDVYAAIEAGGTKIICAVARGDGAILAQTRIATAAPEDNFLAMAGFFDEQAALHGRVRSGGIGSFGPLDLDSGSPTCGCLTTTPKPGWAGVNLRAEVAKILDAPVAIDTDVNCAALAESRFGAGRGLGRLAYMTVGTGIGVGIVDQTSGGAGQAEVGHISVARALGDDFAGICPSHGDCVEGLACGLAIKARWGMSAEDLPNDHIGWAYEAHYIASICVTLTYTLRPQRIIIGGGVLERASLYARIRERFTALAAGYGLDQYSADASSFVSPPELRDPSPGLIGAIELARTIG